MGQVGYVFFKWCFEKKWVGWAMGNKTIYWDGLIPFDTLPSARFSITFFMEIEVSAPAKRVHFKHCFCAFQ